MKKCPHCLGKIHDEAVRCKYCKENISHEEGRIKERNKQLQEFLGKQRERIVIFCKRNLSTIIIIGIIILAIYIISIITRNSNFGNRLADYDDNILTRLTIGFMVFGLFIKKLRKIAIFLIILFLAMTLVVTIFMQRNINNIESSNNAKTSNIELSTFTGNGFEIGYPQGWTLVDEYNSSVQNEIIFDNPNIGRIGVIPYDLLTNKYLSENLAALYKSQEFEKNLDMKNSSDEELESTLDFLVASIKLMFSNIDVLQKEVYKDGDKIRFIINIKYPDEGYDKHRIRCTYFEGSKYVNISFVSHYRSLGYDYMQNNYKAMLDTFKFLTIGSGSITGTKSMDTKSFTTPKSNKILTKQDYDQKCNESWEGTICSSLEACKISVSPKSCDCPNGVVRHKDYHCNVPVECSNIDMFSLCPEYIQYGMSSVDKIAIELAESLGVETQVSFPEYKQRRIELCTTTCRKYFNGPGYKYNGR